MFVIVVKLVEVLIQSLASLWSGSEFFSLMLAAPAFVAYNLI